MGTRRWSAGPVAAQTRSLEMMGLGTEHFRACEHPPPLPSCGLSGLQISAVKALSPPPKKLTVGAPGGAAGPGPCMRHPPAPPPPLPPPPGFLPATGICNRQLEEVAKAVRGGYCRLQMPLKLALAVRETVAGHGLGALEGGGIPCPFQGIPHPPPPPPAHSDSDQSTVSYASSASTEVSIPRTRLRFRL